MYNMNSELLFHEEKKVSLGPTDVKETSAIGPKLSKTKELVFVVLNLKNALGKVISSNIYWISPDNNYKQMREMKETSVNIRITDEKKEKDNISWTIEISNPSGMLAFFIRPQIMSCGEEVLPSLWSRNYISLAPGEKTVVNVTCPLARLKDDTPVLKVSGWNVQKVEVPVR